MMDSVTKKNMTRAQLYGGMQFIRGLCEELERATNASGHFDHTITKRLEFLTKDAGELVQRFDLATYGDLRNAPASPVSPTPPNDGRNTAGVK